MTKVELLAPAGDNEKLKAAIAFGADAVYLGAQAFSLRAKAKNFDGDELKKAIDFAHAYHVRVYVTANIFGHNEDFDGLPEFFVMLQALGADAVIISDPGFFDVCREVAPELEIHISTQANNTNYRSAAFWHRLGAKRIVLARELSLVEITELRAKAPEALKLEAFVHGSMCISYSGRCLLSSFMTNRDANRGACSQPCRFSYELKETSKNESYPVYEDERGTYIMNSKDLCMARHIPELVSSGIESLKIEGRMKTAYYVASVVKTYREAIDDFYRDEALYRSKLDYYSAELEKSSHRGYTTGFYFGKTDESSQNYSDAGYVRSYDFVGVVLSYDKDTKTATVEQRNKFSVGDEIEFLCSEDENFSQTIHEIIDAEGNSVQDAPHAQQIIRIRSEKPLRTMDMLRKRL